MSETDKEKRRRLHLEQHRLTRSMLGEMKGLMASTRMAQTKAEQRIEALEGKVFDQGLKISELTEQLKIHDDTARKMGIALRSLVDSITDDGR